MKSLFTLLLAFTFSLTASAQNKKLTAEEKANLNVKNIVITEETYEDITNPTLNRRKLSKIADQNAGKPKRADDPISRIQYEISILKNPLTGSVPANIRKLEKAYVLSSASGLQSGLKAGGLSFTNSGPVNVGGRTRALAIDMQNENIILAGGTTGGMWKSTDNGENWVRTTDLEDHPSVTAIAQDPTNPITWYYTTGELIGSASEDGALYRGNGLFKSTNNGDSWTSLSSTASNTSEVYDPFDYCWNICIDPNNGDVYVATADGIKRSTDGGNSWADVIASDAYYEDIICTDNGIKYASLSADGTTKGIYRSATGNSGDWENITPSAFPADYDRIVLAYAPGSTSEEILYILAQTIGEGMQGHSFWKLNYSSSTNYSWENRSMNLPEGGDGDRDVNGYDSQGSYNMVIKVAPDDENMVFIGGTNLYRSDDAFATEASPLSVGESSDASNTYWIGGYATENNVSQYPNHHPDVHSLVFKSDNSTLICGHDGGLSITTNYKKKSDTNSSESASTPVDWTFLNNGYLTTQAYTLAIDHDITNSKYMLTGFQDNGTWLGRSASASQEWEYFNSGDGSYCSILDLGEHYLSSSQNGVVYLETDPDGSSYTYTRVDPEGASGQSFINPFIVDANNSEILYYAAGNYIWRNSNIFEIPQLQYTEATKNWEQLEISKISGSVSAIESSTFPAHILYYGTSLGKVYKIENAHSEWAKRTDITGSSMPSGNVISIDANPLNADEVLVGFSNYGIESIFSTTDGGQSWSAVSGNLEEINGENNGPSVRSVSFMVSPTDTTYYAGTSTGLYSTTSLNGSSTIWTQDAMDKIGTTVVAMIKSRRDGFIGAATHGNGVFTADDDFSASAPIALIGMTQDTIAIGESVDFMNRTIGDGTMSWAWTFEGAETETSSLQHPTDIVYNTTGEHRVTLTASNAAGSNTQSISAAIIVKTVETQFTASETSVSVGTEVSFTNQTSSTNTELSYQWTFPGGTPESSTEQNPVVTYNSVGTFDVTLVVSDTEYSDTELKSDYITVLDPDDFDDQLLYNIDKEYEDQLTQYVFTGDNDGYVSGTTNLKIDQFAEKFSITNPNLNALKSVQILPSVMQSNSSDPSINIKVWSGSTEPGELLYKKAVSFSDLIVGEFNDIELAYPVAVDEDFFVGYEVLYEIPVDTFAVAHLPLDAEGGWDNTAYLHYSDSWASYPSIFGGSPNTSLAIKALVGYDAGATGINDELTTSEASELKIYPNPMVYKSNVSFPNQTNQQYRLVVIDASGRVVRIIENITGNNVIINREQLKPGIHIINLSGEKIYKGKLLVK
ncbi:PKD domain-containing protein [Labilibaculum sp.]|uniref:PKD domain-containing protein n=1 Tax=Labilibaculum sp. TaxID=2060723 RepID=UPI0035675C8F